MINSSMDRIQELVSKLGLQEHPEGGFYKETYRSKGVIPREVLPEEFSGPRNYSTGIYFLLTSDTFSAFHKIHQDELWHFYEGSPLIVHMIDSEGKYATQKLGLNFEAGEVPQFMVPAGVWFGAEVSDTGSYTLTGCTVAPGFDFEDFEMAERESLISLFPTHTAIIEKLTRY